MNIGERVVNKDWHIRLQISCFTVPKGTIVKILQLDPEGQKAVVNFSTEDQDWFSYSEIEKYTDTKLIPYSGEWEKLANRVARDFAPSIYSCRHCNYPVVTGYCCDNCRSNDPR